VRRTLHLLAYLPLVAGCVAWSQSAALPSRTSVVRDQLSLHSDFALPRHHRLVEELVALRGDMGAKLDLPASDEPIQVYLFDQASTYNSFLAANYPDFPERRAFFIESDTQLTVIAYWGDRVGEDLRHELAHGYLHSVIPNVPLWLDEGIAEFYESPRGHQGWNASHLALLSKRSQDRLWEPDLRRLESLRDVATMAQVDYAEAWLWTHFLLETTRDRRALVQSYFAELRRSGSAPPLTQFLYSAEPAPEQSLLQHLEEVWSPESGVWSLEVKDRRRE
jgi:hypothetical protein